MIPTLPVFSAKEAKAFDEKAISQGITEEAMMQRAGEEIAVAVQHFAQEHHVSHEIHIMIGKGNNGGDALVAALCLKNKGWDVKVFTCFEEEKLSVLSQYFHNKWREKGGHITLFSPSQLFTSGIILDGIFGAGFHSGISPEVEKMISALNEMKLPILAIDIPSGVDGNTGKVDSIAVKAVKTLCLGFPKKGYYLENAVSYVGEIEYLDYGLPKEIVAEFPPTMQILNPEGVHTLLPEVDKGTHKYKKGYLLVLGGSKGMYGAPKLSSLAALRSGCGIVRLYYPAEDESIVGEMPLEIIHEGLNVSSLEGFAKEQKRAKALLLGPGMNPSSSCGGLIKTLLAVNRLPLIIDGGALSLFHEYEKECRRQEKVVTPHHGESLKLLQSETSYSDAVLLEKMQEFCERTKTICALKGSVTFVLAPKKVPLVIPFGCPGMATAGSGDVLAGMIAAFVAKGMPLYESTVLGVYLHQLAGHEAQKKQSAEGVIASDIIEAIPHVYARVSAKKYSFSYHA